MNKDEVTLLDAGMGKTLAMRGVEIPHTIWSANALIVAPETVVDIHRENIDAGADVITVNSYGVIRSDLARANLESEFESLNRMAGQLAQRAVVASGKNVEIAGSLPPLNGSYRPDRVLDAEVMEPLYREQAGLLAPFVDLFLCETMSRISEAKAAATAAVETGKPVLISFTLHDDKPGCLRSGESLKDAVAQLALIKPMGILANCCLPERISDALPILKSAGLRFCGGYANTFGRVPEDWLLDGVKENDRKLNLRDDLTPALYSRFVRRWIKQGANVVGGCCGTTADHTAKIAEMISKL